MSDDLPAIDRGLLRRLDWARTSEETREPLAPLPAPYAPTSRADISGVLEAVQFAASSMSAMAERIEQLEAHSQAFEVSNRELEVQGAQFAAELSGINQQRDALAADLESEQQRYRELETRVAQHVSRSAGLERDLGIARADLSKIAEVVKRALGVLKG